MTDYLLEVKDLKKYFDTPKGSLHAVDGVSFSLEKGKTLGIVGESGCGKSTTGRALLRLVEPTSGSICFEGKDITKLNRKELRGMRKDMQLIFQDPYSSLDPKMTISQLIREPIQQAGIIKKPKQIEQRVLELMETVGLPPRLYSAYPHELDGGRRQRVGIARALALDPKFIVCDEPVSALDVSIQAQILHLLKQLQRERGLTYIFITHDLSVIYYFADEIAVMYLGRIIEKAPAEELFAHPMHPYTRALLSAIPEPKLNSTRKRILLKGEITSPIGLPQGCRFAPRCYICRKNCHDAEPALTEVSAGHFVACNCPLTHEDV